MNDKFIEESFRGNLICRVELDRTRQKSDGFLPLSQLELTLCLVKACPTRLSHRDGRAGFRCRRRRLNLRTERFGCLVCVQKGGNYQSRSAHDEDRRSRPENEVDLSGTQA